MTPPKTDRCEVPAARTTVELIELLGRESRPMTLTEIARNLNANPPMILRLLRVLEASGWTRRVGAKGPYRLTARPLGFVARAVGADNLPTIVAPILKKVAQKTDCVAVVSIPGAEAAICLSFASPGKSIGVATRVGAELPYRATAPGKILLAFSNDAPLENVLKEPFTRFTPNTIATPEALLTELETTRIRGYAVDDEEACRGVVCLNVPLFDHQNECVATLGISELASHCSLKKLVAKNRAALLTAGKKISSELGYVGEYPPKFEPTDD